MTASLHLDLGNTAFTCLGSQTGTLAGIQVP